MTILKQVSFSEVLDFFNTEHPINSNSPHFAGNEWGKHHIEAADKVSSGVWALCELDAEEVLSVVLPYHESEEGKVMLAEEPGIMVKDAIKKLEQMPSYKDDSPVCFAKMQYWQGKDFSPVFLSTTSLTSAQQGHQGVVDTSLGNLFHLDGLHRLIQWGMDGRFDSETYTNGPKLTAYIAGVK